jgi:hypothetical protein
MDIQEIVSAFGTYYLNSGQNMARIRGLLSQGLVTPSICTAVVTDDTVYQIGALAVGNVVQSFQKGWTPKNAAAFTPNEIRTYRFKVDEVLSPDDIDNTWLAFMRSDDPDRAKWPLVRYLIEHPDAGYIAMINSNMELLEYGKGIYTAPTTGVAGVTGQGMNGLIKLLQLGVDGGTINSIDIETLAKASIFDQVEAFIDGISAIYQAVPMNLCMSPEWARAYLQDKRAQGFYTVPSDNSISLGIDFTVQKIVPLPSLAGTDVIFATPKTNLLHLTSKSSNKTNIRIESARREVSFFCDWREGLGFGMDAAVWTNLQETVVPGP